LMSGGGEFMSEVAQVVFDLPERLILGKVNESVGHAFKDALGIGLESLENGLATNFTVI
jgi:hypothetical protein